MTAPMPRHPRCGGRWRGPFHINSGPVWVCNACGDETTTMPAKPTHTPPRSVRIPDQLWTAAQQRAAERGETVTDAITRALRDYVTPTP